jgi:hypothetical protein
VVVAALLRVEGVGEIGLEGDVGETVEGDVGEDFRAAVATERNR